MGNIHEERLRRRRRMKHHKTLRSSFINIFSFNYTAHARNSFFQWKCLPVAGWWWCTHNNNNCTYARASYYRILYVLIFIIANAAAAAENKLYYLSAYNFHWKTTSTLCWWLLAHTHTFFVNYTYLVPYNNKKNTTSYSDMRAQMLANFNKSLCACVYIFLFELGVLDDMFFLEIIYNYVLRILAPRTGVT